MDPVFEQEQEHLSKTHAKLRQIEAATQEALDDRMKTALGDRTNMLEELTVDFGNDVNLETYVEFEAMHKIIDQYNLANDLNAERLVKTRMLLRRPYFAKVSLRFKPGSQPRDVYIGAAGMTDERSSHFIVDWRSPVAEVYYNQGSGETSYEANGRTINCELVTRRQFDITGDKLNACFDTTVAIEDPLLLESLSKRRTDQLQDITATIQREQNQVVRHKDVPVLLVDGIAGSGKTSVLLQRIAYLFYQQRESLDASQIHLLTPNPVFGSYIDHALPNMGERNPKIETWDELMAKLGLTGRGIGKDVTVESLESIDEALKTLSLGAADFQDLMVDGEKVLSSTQIRSIYDKYSKFPAGLHRASLVVDDLLERIEKRIESRSGSEEVHELIMELPEQEQFRLFGSILVNPEDKELRQAAKTYLTDRYRSIEADIEEGRWLRIDRIGMRILGRETLSAPEWLYVKLALAGGADEDARYVMIDEVQDYTGPQLMVLARLFPYAHFLLLGDENQAVKPGTATFSQICDIFKKAFGSIEECSLMTSYRSTPEITELFTRLMNPDERVRTSSVQRPGNKPSMRVFQNDEEHHEKLCELVRDAAGKEGLTAVLTSWKAAARQLASELEGEPLVWLKEGTPLPEQGVVLADVALAKGLEFDRVIIPDASAKIYGRDDLSRHRLYTAISRATQEVTVMAKQKLTPLLELE